jgi:hypothetical protein
MEQAMFRDGMAEGLRYRPSLPGARARDNPPEPESDEEVTQDLPDLDAHVREADIATRADTNHILRAVGLNPCDSD